MKKSILTLISAALIVFLSSCGCCKKAVGSNILFYKVPLVCGAAPHIGCGSKSKPILIGLEKKTDVVSEAWLNRAGTVIAIVWKANISAEQRTSTSNTIFKENKMEVTQVSGKEEKKMLKDFEKKENWYRGNDVDKLSMEEADIISERLISRINSKTPITKEKSETLKKEFSGIFKNRFTKNYGSEINSNEQRVWEENKKKVEDELLEGGKKYLNETEMVSLKDAISEGLRPTEKEKSGKCCSPKNSSDKNCGSKKAEPKGCCAKPNQ